MNFKQIERLDRFKKELKQLLKRFPSLEEDIESCINTQLIAYHKFNVDTLGILLIEGSGTHNSRIYKVKKFACKSLKGKGAHSGIRMTYAYFEKEDRIELMEIYYIAP